MQATAFSTLRDLVLHHAAGRGWSTQRHIAVVCGLDESALSRFLNGEQDLGARRTHAIFRAVGVPVDQYDLAYTLLGRAQELARTGRQGRARPSASPSRPASVTTENRSTAVPIRRAESSLSWSAGDDLPAEVVVAYFAQQGWDGEAIGRFFGEDTLAGGGRPAPPAFSTG